MNVHPLLELLVGLVEAPELSATRSRSPLSSSFPTATIFSSFLLAFSIENLAAAIEVFLPWRKYRNLVILGVRITHEVSSYYLGVSSLITITEERWQQVVRGLDFEEKNFLALWRLEFSLLSFFQDD